jgi:sigma-B regulation protein RsbU (phosphoserine phosphatase)
MILNETEKSTRNLTRSVANRVEQEFRSVEKVPQNFARFLETSSVNKETLLQLLQNLVKENKEIYGMTVSYEPYAFDSSHEWVAPYYFKGKKGIELVEFEPPGYNYVQQDWYHIPAVKREPVWSDPYFDEGGGNILMTTYSVPFFERDTSGNALKVKGIVTADVSLVWLTKLISTIEVGRTGYCSVISDTGRFITHPRDALIMRESIFSVAEELNRPDLRKVGREMIHQDSGFVDLGTSLSGRESYLAFAQIPSTGWSLGAIFPKDELFEKVDQLYFTTLISGLAGIILLMLVSLLVARSLARPLRRMADATAKVAAGDLNIDLSDIRSRDEVGSLARSFTQMTDGLKQRDFIRDTFGRYLTKEVVNRLLEAKDGLQLGGESREITIMMSDIRGFTAVTANMQPEQVITFLNRYLGKVVEILLDHRGTIDEIVGDGILAFFGAPEPFDDHPAHAVTCALKMQQAMDAINEVNEKEGLPHIEMGVAVNTGNVVVGNIGSEKRSKYAAVGPQMNFTGRMESYTVGGQVLISASTYEKLSKILDIKGEVKVEMKGMAGKVTLYDVIGIGGDYNVHLNQEQDNPVLLKQGIPVRINRLDEKLVTDATLSSQISHASLTSAILVLGEPVKQWENLKIEMFDKNMNSIAKDVYGKVVSVSQSLESYEAVIRFTSIPGEGYRQLRRFLEME